MLYQGCWHFLFTRTHENGFIYTPFSNYETIDLKLKFVRILLVVGRRFRWICALWCGRVCSRWNYDAEFYSDNFAFIYRNLGKVLIMRTWILMIHDCLLFTPSASIWQFRWTKKYACERDNHRHQSHWHFYSHWAVSMFDSRIHLYMCWKRLNSLRLNTFFFLKLVYFRS